MTAMTTFATAFESTVVMSCQTCFSSWSMLASGGMSREMLRLNFSVVEPARSEGFTSPVCVGGGGGRT